MFNISPGAHAKHLHKPLAHSRGRAQEIKIQINQTAMGKQKNRGKRDRMIGVWCDEKEYRFIEKSAETSGISKANYCRKVVLGERSQDSTLGKNRMLKVDVEDIKKELLSVGNNLNQIAKKINTFEQPLNKEILDKIHHDYERVYTKILKRLV